MMDATQKRMIAERQDELPAARRQIVGDHVERHHLSARLVGAAFVEPALGGHDHAGHAEAADEPHRRPGEVVDDQDEPERRDRHDRGKRCKRADMADRRHHAHRLDASREQAQEVGGHDQPRHRRREALDLRAQPDQGPEQAVREQQQAVRGEQRRDGGEGLANKHRGALGACALGNGSASAGQGRYRRSFFLWIVRDSLPPLRHVLDASR